MGNDSSQRIALFGLGLDLMQRVFCVAAAFACSVCGVCSIGLDENTTEVMALRRVLDGVGCVGGGVVYVAAAIGGGLAASIAGAHAGIKALRGLYQRAVCRGVCDVAFVCGFGLAYGACG